MIRKPSLSCRSSWSFLLVPHQAKQFHAYFDFRNRFSQKYLGFNIFSVSFRFYCAKYWSRHTNLFSYHVFWLVLFRCLAGLKKYLLANNMRLLLSLHHFLVSPMVLEVSIRSYFEALTCRRSLWSFGATKRLIFHPGLSMVASLFFRGLLCA